MNVLIQWGHALLHFVQMHDYLALYLLLSVEEAGVPLPMPGDTVVAFAGHLVRQGQMVWWLVFLSAVGGSVTGSIPLYALMRWKGHPLLLRYGKYLHLNAAREQRVEGWLERHGGAAVFVGRLVPGLRVGTTALAGTFHVPFWTFLGYLIASASVWWGSWLVVGAIVGRRLAPLLHLSPVVFLIAAVAIAIVVAGYVYLRRLEAKKEPTHSAP